MKKYKNILITSLIILSTFILSGCTQSKESLQMDFDKSKEILIDLDSAKNMDMFILGAKEVSKEYNIDTDYLNKYLSLDNTIAEQELKLEQIQNKSVKEFTKIVIDLSKEMSMIINKGLAGDKNIQSVKSDIEDSDIRIEANPTMFINLVASAVKIDLDVETFFGNLTNEAKDNFEKKYSEKVNLIVSELILSISDDIYSEEEKNMIKDALLGELGLELNSNNSKVDIPIGDTTSTNVDNLEDDYKSSIESKQEVSKNTNSSSEDAILEYISLSNLVLDEYSWDDDKESVTTSIDEKEKTGVSSSIYSENGFVDYIEIHISDKATKSAVKEHLKPAEAYFKSNGKISEEIAHLYKEVTSDAYINSPEGQEQYKDGFLAIDNDIIIGGKRINIEIFILDPDKSLTDNIEISILA